MFVAAKASDINERIVFVFSDEDYKTPETESIDYSMEREGYLRDDVCYPSYQHI